MSNNASPWPLLRRLRQGDREETALVDARGYVVARVSAPEAYQGDLRTAVERGDLTAEIVSAAATAPALYEALENILWATPEKTAFTAEKLIEVLHATARAALALAPQQPSEGNVGGET